MKPRPVDSWTRAQKDAARAILLERSPWDADGGELIGRDPRKIEVGEFERAGIEGTQAAGGGLAVIRARCMDCCGEQPDEVRKCVAITWVNWPYRMGANPFRKQNLSDEERAARGERLRQSRERLSAEANPLAANSASSPDAPPAPSEGVRAADASVEENP
jgi:hypothetical protein